jgi:hypothetical protein
VKPRIHSLQFGAARDRLFRPIEVEYRRNTSSLSSFTLPFLSAPSSLALASLCSLSIKLVRAAITCFSCTTMASIHAALSSAEAATTMMLFCGLEILKAKG